MISAARDPKGTSLGRVHLVAGLLAVLALALPVLAALQLAHRQAEADELAYLGSIADEVLRKGIVSRKQVVQAIRTMRDDRSAPCSTENLSRLAQVSVGSSYLQAVGVVRDGRMICSSLGLHGSIALGPSQVTATGFEAWTAVSLPFAPGQAFNLYGKDGYVAVLHPDLPLDILVRDSDVKVALIIVQPRIVTRVRGSVPLAWLDRQPLDRSGIIENADHYVVLRTSAEHNLSGIAAAPKSFVRERVIHQSWRLLPFGVVAGLLLVLAVVMLARQRLSMAAEIRTGLRKREFFVHYQPIVDLKTQELIGAEALLRWRRGDGGNVSPAIFIPAAEQAGEIQRITRYVMQQVGKEAGPLLRQFAGFHVSINFSSLDLAPGGPADELAPLLHALRVPPGGVMVEVTERGFLDAEVAGPLIRRLRAAGVEIAVDDFGTGYSSLSTLQSFEIDYLKIDKSFVDTIGANAATSQVIPHIIHMGRSLRLRMIAEGVETTDQADYLRSAGVEFAQGWLFGKPMPWSEMEALVRAQAAQKDGAAKKEPVAPV